MIEVSSAAPPRVFVPVTIVINSAVDLANLVGALIAYGKGEVYAENGLKAIGLGDWYSGNVRAAARDYVGLLTDASNGFIEPPPDFDAYLSSSQFTNARPSKAGAAVIGTDEDRAPGRESTTFEPFFQAPESFED